MRIRTNRPRIALHLTVVALAVAAVVGNTVPSLADHCDGDGSVFEGGGSVIGECHVSDPGEPGETTVSTLWDRYCTAAGPFEAGNEVAIFELGPVLPEEIDLLGLNPTGSYVWYDVVCTRNGRILVEVQIIVVDTPPVPAQVLRDIAATRLEPPTPQPATSPSVTDVLIVGIETWLWLDPASWSPIEASESRGITTVTVRATPVSATWSMGDATTVTCNGPGTMWTPESREGESDCVHTYLAATYGEPGGVFRANVSVRWDFEWWINGAPQGVFGAVDVVTGFTAAVAEIQAIESGG